MLIYLLLVLINYLVLFLKNSFAGPSFIAHPNPMPIAMLIPRLNPSTRYLNESSIRLVLVSPNFGSAITIAKNTIIP